MLAASAFALLILAGCFYVMGGQMTIISRASARATVIAELGERQISANARNYYLSAAQFLLRDVPKQ